MKDESKCLSISVIQSKLNIVILFMKFFFQVFNKVIGSI